MEARESIEEKAQELHGVAVEERFDETGNVHITRVTVETKNGAKMLGKPMGIYITLEAPAMTEPARAGQRAFRIGGRLGQPGSDGRFPGP